MWADSTTNRIAEWFMLFHRCKFVCCVNVGFQRRVPSLLMDIGDTLQTVGGRYPSEDMPIHVDQMSTVDEIIHFYEDLKRDAAKKK